MQLSLRNEGTIYREWWVDVATYTNIDFLQSKIEQIQSSPNNNGRILVLQVSVQDFTFSCLRRYIPRDLIASCPANYQC